jgi:spore coat protein U-like protein
MRTSILMAFVAMVLSVLGLLVGGGPAAAQTTTDTFQVRAEVQKACTVVANDLDFGIYSSTQQSRASTSLSVQCTPLTPFAVEIGPGGSGQRNAREMTGPATLAYALYKDSGYSEPTETTGSDFTGTIDLAGTAMTFPVYGEVAANQVVPAGSYLDTVTVTVTY